MKWVMDAPERGDMIRVELGGIYHFGIYVSDEEVIQFGMAPSRRAMLHDSEVEVLSSDIDSFLAGGFLEVCRFDRKERKKNRSADQIVDYARSKLGTRGYNIIYNNCEHFANECVSGQHICNQAADVRAMFRNMPIVDVYVAQLPQRQPDAPVSCDLRQEELDQIDNDQVKREKYFAWKLLGYGLERSLGLKIDQLTFTKTQGGQYRTDKVQFSISHSHDALAVAVSRDSVGVDIESADAPCREGMAQRTMTAGELAQYEALPEGEKDAYFVRLWCAKEALFKAASKDAFEPTAYDTAAGGYAGFEKTVAGKPYHVAVATATPERIRFFENINL